MTERDAAALVQEMRGYIHKKVAAGFLDADEIAETAFDCFSDDLADARLEPAMLRRIAEGETDKAFAERLDAQRNWPAVTDCDRLDQAFADLDRSGIVARQNFTCCQNCGHAEIGDEIAAAKRSGTRPIGYTFFHWQTTDHAVEDGNLYLYYGAVAGDGAASVRIGRVIVATLERQGLAVDWNGSLDKAIHVKLKWQRRVSQRMAERGPRMR
jgi:hypothetical protein